MSIVQGHQANINNRLRKKISSFSVDKDDLHLFCKLLQEKSSAATDIETQKYERGERTEEQYQANLKILRECSELRLTVSGEKGGELYGSVEDVFGSVNFPSHVKSFFVNSAHLLKDRHNYIPFNSFVIFLDFSKPSVFDFSLMPSQTTPNGSNYEVQGYDATWANGVFHEIEDFIKRRASMLSVVHNHSIYDFLVWFIGLPISFRICYKLSPYIEQIATDRFLISALYVYCFFMIMQLFRMLFHYLRWICPLVEYKSKNSMIILHRIFFSGITLMLLRTYILDLISVFMSFLK